MDQLEYLLDLRQSARFRPEFYVGTVTPDTSLARWTAPELAGSEAIDRRLVACSGVLAASRNQSSFFGVADDQYNKRVERFARLVSRR